MAYESQKIGGASFADLMQLINTIKRLKKLNLS